MGFNFITKAFLLFSMLCTCSVLAVENCPIDSSMSKTALELVEAMVGFTEPLGTRVISIKVNHDGSGAVRVLTDASGNLIGIRLDYKDSDGEAMQETKTVEQFNKGDSVAFKVEGEKNHPLMLETKSGTVLSKDKGGSFSFSLMTSKDPLKYVHYPLDLIRVNGVWKVKKADKVVTKTTIEPNISLFSWDGTFKKAIFE